MYVSPSCRRAVCLHAPDAYQWRWSLPSAPSFHTKIDIYLAIGPSARPLSDTSNPLKQLQSQVYQRHKGIQRPILFLIQRLNIRHTVENEGTNFRAIHTQSAGSHLMSREQPAPDRFRMRWRRVSVGVSRPISRSNISNAHRARLPIPVPTLRMHELLSLAEDPSARPLLVKE